MATFTTGRGKTRPNQGVNMIADKNYFLDAEGNLTTDEEAAATRLINQGQEVPKHMADKYGIGKVAQEAAEAEVEEKPAPAENKAKQPTKNKGAK